MILLLFYMDQEREFTSLKKFLNRAGNGGKRTNEKRR